MGEPDLDWENLLLAHYDTVRELRAEREHRRELEHALQSIVQADLVNAGRLRELAARALQAHRRV